MTGSNRRHRGRNALLTLAAALTLACGPTGTVVGIDRLGFVEGTITAFGSIWVNGIHIETDGADIVVDDSPGLESDLRVGQVVRVEASLSDDGTTGTATRVVFENEIEGPIESIDLVTSRMTVVGQIVAVDLSTSFDDDISPPSLAGLDEGDFVEVSGLRDADGVIRATRLELRASTDVELRGVVSGHDSFDSTFMIGTVEVDYADATLEGFGSGSIDDGQVVEVKAPSYTPGLPLDADEVELEDRLGDDDGLEAEIEGFVTRFVSATDFDVSGRPVITTPSTVFEGGLSSELALNVKVEVEGRIDELGTLVARKVDIRRAANVRIDALVDSVDDEAGELVLLGVTVLVDARTRLEDKSDAELSPFALSDISPGDYVEMRGGIIGGDVVASRLERDDDDSGEVSIRGFIDAFDRPDFEILGVTIETDGVSSFTGVSWNDADGFFDNAEAGDLVEVSGVEIAPTTVLAEEVQEEIE